MEELLLMVLGLFCFVSFVTGAIQVFKWGQELLNGKPTTSKSYVQLDIDAFSYKMKKLFIEKSFPAETRDKIIEAAIFAINEQEEKLLKLKDIVLPSIPKVIETNTTKSVKEETKALDNNTKTEIMAPSISERSELRDVVHKLEAIQNEEEQSAQSISERSEQQQEPQGLVNKFKAMQNKEEQSVKETSLPNAIEKEQPFLLSKNIKTLLVSGSALFLFSAYLFATSYWEFIPEIVKFIMLFVATFVIYITGSKLFSRTPKTAETLMVIAISLIPFNFFAFNFLLLTESLPYPIVWGSGFFVASMLARITLRKLATMTMGILFSGKFLCAVFFASALIQESLQVQVFFTSLAMLVLFAYQIKCKFPEEVNQGFAKVFYACSGISSFGIAMYFPSATITFHILLVASLAMFALFYVVQARTIHHDFAYIASALFLFGSMILSDFFHMSIYEYGFILIPVACIFIVRAFYFEKNNKKDIATPYFNVGHLAIVFSIFVSFGSFDFITTPSFPFISLVTLYAVAVLAYVGLGVLYRKEEYTYASAVSILLLIFVISSHMDLNFTTDILLFVTAGFLYTLCATIDKKIATFISQPLALLGSIVISIALSLLATRWLLADFGQNFPPEQLQLAIIVTVVSIASYSLLALVKKKDIFFPILGSISFLYMLILAKLGLSATITHAATIVAFSFLGSYFFYKRNANNVADNFRFWGQAVFGFIILYSFSTMHLDIIAMAICILALLPSLLFAPRIDFVVSLVTATYFTHMLYYINGSYSPHTYAMHLIPLNCAIVTIRTLITISLPKVPIEPFKIGAILFSLVSLSATLDNPTNAWQVYLAYSILAILVSVIHYQGRYIAVGFTLLLLAVEFFLTAQGVKLTEAYSIPFALYFYAWQSTIKENNDQKKALTGIALFALFAPSFFYSLQETWAWHGMFLQVSSIFVMILGMYKRNKILTATSFTILLLNGFIQSRLFFGSVPRWIYLGLGGVFLVSIGAIFEFKRELILQTQKKIGKILKDWD